jgi:hypothetical protein
MLAPTGLTATKFIDASQYYTPGNAGILSLLETNTD